MDSKGKILVTGGAGFIGAHTVVELVEAGYDPVIVDDLSASDNTLLNGLKELFGKDMKFYHGDCGDAKWLGDVFKIEKDISAVMHFAAFKSVGESVQEPLKYYRNNINSLLSVLEKMKQYSVEDLIFSSSCTVYGQPDVIPVTENAPFKKAESPYGATKQMCERILEDSFPTGYKIVSLRYFNPVGAHPSGMIGELPVGIPNNLLPYVTQTAAGIRETLTVFGDDYDTPDGSCIRDYIHVSDVARAHVQALNYLREKKGKYFEAFNLGTGKGVSVLELIKTFEQANGLTLNYQIGPRRLGDVIKVFADPSRIQTAMNWHAAFSLEQAMRHAWNWQQKIATSK
ncbi:MAG: UDP-glucose 4-epimerase GalE [Cyclobacteriaceae bacterium]